MTNEVRKIIASYPETTAVLSAHGRPDDGTDATGFFNVEFFVPLKPFDTWPSGMTKEKLIDELSTRLAKKYPGVDFSFSQIIEDNVEEAASGVKAPIRSSCSAPIWSRWKSWPTRSRRRWPR